MTLSKHSAIVADLSRSFSSQLTHKVLTKILHCNGGAGTDDVTLTRENTTDQKILADLMVFGDQNM